MYVWGFSVKQPNCVFMHMVGVSVHFHTLLIWHEFTRSRGFLS
jgi:hypothetical protein